MSEACGCGSDDRNEGEQEPERLWEITELRAAAAAGVVLLAGYAVGWSGGIAGQQHHPRGWPAMRSAGPAAPMWSKSACMRWRWRSGPTRSYPRRCAG